MKQHFKLEDYEFTRGQGGLSLGRHKVRDVAFTFRMSAGAPGEVNRTHPASIEPVFFDGTKPPTFYGEAVIIDATSHLPRRFDTGDSAVTYAYGCVVRPYPTQQPQANTDFAPASFNVGVPSTKMPGDVLRSGYIMVKLGDGTITGAAKGKSVFVWCAASTGAHVQGGFEVAAGGGINTAALDSRYTFNGVEDANGIVELSFNQ